MSDIISLYKNTFWLNVAFCFILRICLLVFVSVSRLEKPAGCNQSPIRHLSTMRFVGTAKKVGKSSGSFCVTLGVYSYWRCRRISVTWWKQLKVIKVGSVDIWGYSASFQGKCSHEIWLSLYHEEHETTVHMCSQEAEGWTLAPFVFPPAWNQWPQSITWYCDG